MNDAFQRVPLGPLLTQQTLQRMQQAVRGGARRATCSLDLQRSNIEVEVDDTGFVWQSQRYAYPNLCKPRTIYHWTGDGFEPVARFGSALIKLVPTEWGAPTFEIDGIKMLPTAQVSPYADAQRKVALIAPRGKVILDTCGGLGYFAAWCLHEQAAQVMSFEKNPEVIWLRSLNPWSPPVGNVLTLTLGDVTQHIATLGDRSVDAILHDPPRFGIAGELYSQAFYEHLARVIKPKGRLFHYTGTPNKLSSGRDLPNEVSKRLRGAGFMTELNGDGVLAKRKSAGIS